MKRVTMDRPARRWSELDGSPMDPDGPDAELLAAAIAAYELRFPDPTVGPDEAAQSGWARLGSNARRPTAARLGYRCLDVCGGAE